MRFHITTGILEKHIRIKGEHIVERQNLSDVFMGETFLKDH
jgi:hypothetical protein